MFLIIIHTHCSKTDFTGSHQNNPGLEAFSSSSFFPFVSCLLMLNSVPWFGSRPITQHLQLSLNPLFDPSVHAAVPRERSVSPVLPSNNRPRRYPELEACTCLGHRPQSECGLSEGACIKKTGRKQTGGRKLEEEACGPSGPGHLKNESESVSRSVSDSLWPHGLQPAKPARLFHLWDFSRQEY